MICKICGEDTGSIPIGTHLLYKHGNSPNSKEYYDKYLKQPGDGECAECGNPTKFVKGKYLKLCSNKCQFIYIKKTPEYKAKISERGKIISKQLWKDPEYRKKITSLKKKGDKQMAKNWQNPEFRKARSEQAKKQWEDPETRARWTEARSIQATMQNQDRLSKWGGDREYDGEGGFKSKHELAFAKRCEKEGIEYLHERWTFKMDNGHRYTPDFFLPEYGVFVEIKAKQRYDKDIQDRMNSINDQSSLRCLQVYPEIAEYFFEELLSP